MLYTNMNKKDYDKEYYLKHRERLLEYASKYRMEHLTEINTKARIWREKHGHPCMDCGILIVNPQARRCKSCAAKVSNAKFKVHYPPCIDCGGPVSRGRSLRCHHCAMQAKRKIKRLDGKYQDSQGYIHIGTIFEHRLVWEREYNQTLPDGWVIHHINGKRDDNRIDNLLALPKGKHHYALLIQEKNKRIQKLEALLRKQGQLI